MVFRVLDTVYDMSQCIRALDMPHISFTFLWDQNRHFRRCYLKNDVMPSSERPAVSRWHCSRLAGENSAWSAASSLCSSKASSAVIRRHPASSGHHGASLDFLKRVNAEESRAKGQRLPSTVDIAKQRRFVSMNLYPV